MSMTDRLLNGLNPQQQKQSNNEWTSINGAGSGKTRVLTSYCVFTW